MIKNIFDIQVTNELIGRINKLQPEQKPLWGVMSVDQMLAHCNVPYNYTFFPENFKKPNFLVKFILKYFVKNFVVGDKPYQKNTKTSPDFIMKTKKNFEEEKNILISNIEKTQKLGAQYFENRENISFGKLTSNEWNNLFYKHLNHHLNQFGV